tara:strand:- start:970 stop:1674 length:705 start_codon:yes stop_codon:yes gene_type:complete
MQAVILAGGKGTRFGDITKKIPKPMIKIGNKPIIWHIIKHLSSKGIKQFIVCTGYKETVIRKYLSTLKENWDIKCVYTGLNTLTGKRVGKISKYIKGEFFLMTYGDGVSDINLKKLIQTHKKKNKLATVTAVSPAPRFGSLKISKNIVTKFSEKPVEKKNLINGGFFILDKKIFNFLNLKLNVMWEQEPLINLTKKKQLAAYIHKGFWYAMDTERDQKYLNDIKKRKLYCFDYD